MTFSDYYVFIIAIILIDDNIVKMNCYSILEILFLSLKFIILLAYYTFVYLEFIVFI